MTRKACGSALLVLLVAGVWLRPAPASATLGEGADSVAKDRRMLGAQRGGDSDHGRYRVQEATVGGTRVREYLDAHGVVFAVAWDGMAHPDLGALLGSYHEEFQQTKRGQVRQRGQSSRRVEAAHVVVETWGHMRSLQGRAYLPGRLPAGVTNDEIK